MKCTFEMTSDALIDIKSFIKIGSAIRKLIGGDTQTDTQTHAHTARSRKPTFIISK
jgi:hypothetical protein